MSFILTFRPYSYDPCVIKTIIPQVHGFIEDVTGSRVATVFGKWDKSIYCVIKVPHASGPFAPQCASRFIKLRAVVGILVILWLNPG